ncbi:MAG: hypothetical protein IJY47_02360 [Clostridia bacterium]|nr:hypothetical protein [Clostridia bacterium]
MKKTKKSYIITTFVCTVLIAGVLWGVLSRAFGIWRKGIAYFADHPEKYDYVCDPINETIEFSINLKNITSNIGKVIYQRDGCRIEISDIDESNYRIFFRSYGTDSLNSVTLISGIRHDRTASNKSTLHCNAELQIKDNDVLYHCSLAGMNGLSYRDGDMFGFYIFSEEYLEKNIDEAASIDEITFCMSGFLKNEWRIK